MQKSRRTSLMALGLLFAFPIKSKDAWNDLSKRDKIVCAFGIGAVGALAIYSCIAYFSESDETMLSKTYDRQKNLSDHVNELFAIMSPFKDEITDKYERNHIMNNASEHDLYAIITHLKKNNHSMQDYYSTLCKEIKWLEHSRVYLHKRIITLMKKSSYSYNHLIAEMEILLKMLDELSAKASLVKDYCALHEAYFKLYEAEEKVRADFKDEIYILQSTPVDKFYLKSAIYSSIQDKKSNKFPHLAYVSMIDKDIALLQETIASSSNRYKDRLNWTRWLVDSLNYLKSIVVIEPEYTNEIYQHARETLTVR